MVYWVHVVETGLRAVVPHPVVTERDLEDSARLHLFPSCPKISPRTILHKKWSTYVDVLSLYQPSPALWQ